MFGLDLDNRTISHLSVFRLATSNLYYFKPSAAHLRFTKQSVSLLTNVPTVKALLKFSVQWLLLSLSPSMGKKEKFKVMSKNNISHWKPLIT